MIPRFSVVSVGYSLFFASIVTLPSSAEPGKPIYEVAAGMLPTDWKGFGKQELVEGVWQISEQESDKHVAAPKIPLPCQNFVAEFEWRLPTAKSAIFRLDVNTGHLGGLSWTPGVDGKPGRLVLVQQDYDRERGPAKSVWLDTKLCQAPREQWMKVRFELNDSRLKVDAGGIELKADQASFAQPKTTLAFTVAGGSAQIRNLKLWKTTK